jgi:hypothetical protein
VLESLGNTAENLSAALEMSRPPKEIDLVASLTERSLPSDRRRMAVCTGDLFEPLGMRGFAGTGPHITATEASNLDRAINATVVLYRKRGRRPNDERPELRYFADDFQCVLIGLCRLA